MIECKLLSHNYIKPTPSYSLPRFIHSYLDEDAMPHGCNTGLPATLSVDRWGS